MKRILALLLALMVSVCANAENTENTEDMESSLLLAKEQLGISDTGDFSAQIDGDLYSFYWQSASCQVKSGDVVSFYDYTGETYAGDGTLSRRYPKADEAEVLAGARAFLDTVLKYDYELDEYSPRLTDKYFKREYVSGCLCFFGVKSDISFNLSLSSDDAGVISFTRSDAWQDVCFPAADTPVLTDDDGIMSAFKEACALTGEYRLTGDTAQLVYVRKTGGRVLVNAQTGAIETETEEYYYSKGAMADEAAADSALLSAAEIRELERYTGVLSEGELDAAARSLINIDIDEKDELCETRYYDSDGIYARLTYKSEDEIYKYITLDAHTGAPESMYSWLDCEANAASEEFLSTYFPNEYAKCQSLTRYENGYPYKENYLSAYVNPETGRVCAFSRVWDWELSFEEPSDPIGEEAALEIYLKDALALPVWANIDGVLTKCLYPSGIEAIEYIDAMGNVIKSANEASFAGPFAAYGIDFCADDTCLTKEALEKLLLDVQGVNPGENAFKNYFGFEIEADELTLSDMLKVLLKAAGFEAVCELYEIYTLDAEGFELLSDSDKGYAAVGCALGLIDAGSVARLYKAATNADAAHAVDVYLAASY